MANVYAKTLLSNNMMKKFKQTDIGEKRVFINIGSQSAERGPTLFSYPFFMTKQYSNYMADCLKLEAE